MDLFELFWDLRQQRRIEDNERGLDEAKDRLHEVADDVTALNQEVNLLLIVLGALVDVLQSKGVASDQEIKDAIVRSKQKLTRPDVCESCHRGYNLELNRCVYCGHVNRDNTRQVVKGT